MSIAGATGIQGQQGYRGPIGPRGPTGATGWSQQGVINQYRNNPTGPDAGMGRLVITSVSSGGSTISLSSPGTIYQINGSTASVTTTTTTVGTFYILQNISSGVCAVTYTGGTLAGIIGGTLNMLAGQSCTLVYASTNTFHVF